MSKPLNLDGQKFGEWLVLSTEIKLHGKTKPRTASFCICKCTCGIIRIRTDKTQKVELCGTDRQSGGYPSVTPTLE